MTEKAVVMSHTNDERDAVAVMMMEVDICQEHGAADAAYDACDEHEGESSGESKTSSSSSIFDERDEDADARDLAPSESESDESGVIPLEHFCSSVSLDEKELVVMETTMADLSRKIMFNRYARAVPSAQERHPTEPFKFNTVSSNGAHPPAPMHIVTGMTASSSMAPVDDESICGRLSCQEHAKWKYERIQELQKALDHMVDAMAIQQRDMATQRAFLARQSEQLTKLSMTLHQEKLALQIEKERFQKMVRGTCSMTPTASSSSSRPPTPSAGSSSRSSTPRATKSIGAVFSTFSTRTDNNNPRRKVAAAVSSINEHAVVIPSIETDIPPLSTATTIPCPAGSTSTSSIAQDDQLVNASRDEGVSRNSFAADALSFNLATEVERCSSLSALEIRPTLLSLNVSSTMQQKLQPSLPVQMSDVNLLDGASPVRFGSRSVTNCFAQESRKDPGAAAVGFSTSLGNSSPASLNATAATENAVASVETSRKPSLGERFRSIRWK
uniref:Uncharacterized protein n=1 Tax=Globisporangium ultimum (strain ATCC 200006 / CBS 805.95 / DAOM BR144) TaxID=431595 RepID=K3XAZ5_GLOUD